MNDDREHLRLLSVFHYVVAGFAGLFACIPLIHLTIGLAMLSGRFPGPSNAMPEGRLVGSIFVGLASVILIVGWTLVALLVLAGRSLARHRRYTFCLVMAAISCAFMPFGTVLGVFTLLVLLKPSVKELFGVGSAPAAG